MGADLQNVNDAERSFRKFKLIVEDVQGKECLTAFHGMNLTTDKLRSMVKKWQTLIEGNVDVKTTDGYMLRLFCIGFTTKLDRSTKKTCYAQSSQIKNIRKKMVDIIQREVSSTDLKDVVAKLIPDSIASDIAKACQGIYPLHDVHIRKVKVLKRPRFDPPSCWTCTAREAARPWRSPTPIPERSWRDQRATSPLSLTLSKLFVTISCNSYLQLIK